MLSAEANLVAGMKWLQNTHTRPFNLRPRLWRGRLYVLLSSAVLLSFFSHSYAYEVFIGGFAKQDQLLDRDKWSFVADNCDGYYNHPNALQKMDLTERQKIAALFKNKAAILEANNHRGPTPWANEPSATNPNAMSIKAAGFVSYGALIAAGGGPLETWLPLAAQYHRDGVPNLFVMTGISLGTKREGWKDPRNDSTRTLLLDPSTVGCGVDEPVNLFLSNRKWRESTFEEIIWTHQQNKKFIYLISPNSSGSNFLAYSQQVVRALEARGTSPDIYAVQYYRRGYDMTPETVPDTNGVAVPANTVTGIAYWLLKHRDGGVGFADLWVRDNARNTTYGQYVIDATAVADGQVVRLDSSVASPRNYTINVTSRDPTVDYAPVVQARLSEASKGWNVTFSVDGQDVTGDVLKDGYAFVGQHILLPGTTQYLTMTITRNAAASDQGSLNLTLLLRSNLANATVRDMVKFTTSLP